MQLFEQQQFEFLLQTAVERFVERLEQRFRGPDLALENLRRDPNSQGVWLNGFCEAVFEDFLLNNIDGACFVLRALAQRTIEDQVADYSDSDAAKVTAPAKSTVESHLVILARKQFCQLLHQKSLEALEQHSGYQTI